VTVYVDSSVVLRIVFGEPEPLPEWRRITTPVASELTRLECLRTIDRARIRGRLPDEEVAVRRVAVLEQLEAFDIIRIDPCILARAAEPFPTSLGSLDSIHLATALAARPQMPGMAVATHDAELGIAARAVGFTVFGVDAR
jgi:predicted nucleic acid-binding protein